MPRPVKVQLYSKFMLKLQRELSVNRKEKTVEYIMSTLLVLQDGKPFHDLEWLKNTEVVLTKLKAVSGTNGSLKTHLARLKTILGAETPEAYQKQFEECKAEEKRRLEAHEKTPAEETKLVSYERVMEVRKQLREECMAMTEPLSAKDYEKQQMYLLMLLYTEFPPRRGDYVNMDVVPLKSMATDDTLNYYCIDSGEFIFQNYKTVKTYGKQVFEVPEGLQAGIEQLTAGRVGQTGCPLFVLQNGNRINTSTLSIWLTKLFGHNMGPSALRHIVINHTFPTLGQDYKKRQEFARMMAHSVEEQLHYWKGTDD